ncbi:pimeloyl-ACP methyl ester carboxylesterase [Bacillus ectoiniformans]|uniref:alpha/beta fold hydrolase n=1 Tax=Bacillus ectoiniformans TaxID=1494429 RepID=UPI001958BF7A|nr:alpha/beta hydrolase [Bacillus ectoiniformans]MBM7647754.1 pimeloyl-ACP methyl ester carboxylesterase [Bacillus ectoiniformans]
MPYAEERGKKIYYEKTGTGPVVIFIHPPGMSGYVFKYQLELQEEMTIVQMDLNGHGKSNSSLGTSLNSFIEDIDIVQKHLGEEKVFLFGYSSGGTVVQQYALTYPERVSGVLLSGGFPKVGTTALKWEHRIGIQLVKVAPAALARLISSSHFSNDVEKDIMYQQMMRADRRVWQNFYQLSLAFNITNDLKSWQTPLMLIYSDRAKQINHHSIYYKQIPQSSIHFINEANHQLPTKSYEQINPLIASFVHNYAGQSLGR